MGIRNEYGTPNSGVTDICEACPEFDVMVSSHEHSLIEDARINGVLVVQNRPQAQTMSVVDLTFVKSSEKWRLSETTARSVSVGGFEADRGLMDELSPFDERARIDAETVIGRLEGDALAPNSAVPDMPAALLRDTALINLINEVQMHYSGASVSATALCAKGANMQPGVIRKCDVAFIYKFSNALYKLRMTGAQLRKYMEWSARFYNDFAEGDLTISFNPDVPAFDYDIFDGVAYEINISNRPGHRIQNLTWLNGDPVRDEDVFAIAVNDYRANSQLLVPGEIFKDGDTPELLEMDVRGELGGIRELIRDYIANVKNRVITPDKNRNWKLTGYGWDAALHERAISMASSGILAIPSGNGGRAYNTRSLTANDIFLAQEQSPEI